MQQDIETSMFVPSEDSASLHAGSPFFQKVDVQGFSVMIEFQQQRVDVAALWARQPAEIANLVPWGFLQLSLPSLTLKGVMGWPQLLTTVINSYNKDIKVGSSGIILHLCQSNMPPTFVCCHPPKLIRW